MKSGFSFDGTYSQNVFAGELAHTYSIVARDPETGEMGVAVQSHWFSVGSLVPWAEDGVGAIAIQAFAHVSMGVRGLELLRQGKTAQGVVRELIESDERRDVRQLAIVDSKGNVAAHTGERCIPEAGHYIGDSFSVQANMMLSDKVWPAMAKAFEESRGHLAVRMIAALEAAEDAGGDIRGKQSASILVVKAHAADKTGKHRVFDLRVEDHPEPIKELKRLLKVFEAYEYMKIGNLATEKNDIEGALKAYSRARTMLPDNLEVKYWHAVSLANLGMIKDALPIFEEVFAKSSSWLVLTRRVHAVGRLNVSEEDLDRILSLMASPSPR